VWRQNFRQNQPYHLEAPQVPTLLGVCLDS
jgi:hypothetical protein